MAALSPLPRAGEAIKPPQRAAATYCASLILTGAARAVDAVAIDVATRIALSIDMVHFSLRWDEPDYACDPKACSS